jgi:hypothetical protein
MDNQGEFYKSGNSIYFTGDDYNGNDHTVRVATFICPGGYTATITLTDSNGNQVAWYDLVPFRGPYTVEAETEASAQQS